MESIPFQAPATANDDRDVKIIGAKLQSLLRIPPIQKNVSGNTEDFLLSTTTASQPGSRPHGVFNQNTDGREIKSGANICPTSMSTAGIRHQEKTFENDDRAGRKHGKHYQQNSRPIRLQNAELSEGVPRDKRQHEPPITILRRPKTDNEVETRGPSRLDLSGVKRNSYTNESTRSKTNVENSRYKNEIHKVDRSANDRERQSTVSHAALEELFSRAECPADIKNARQIIVEASLGEYKPSYYLNMDQQVLRLFKHHYIDILRKKSPKFPRARYHCGLCNYHMDATYNVIAHIINERHYSKAKREEFVMLLEWINPPSSTHKDALTNYIMSVVNEVGISNNEIMQRQCIVDRLNEVVQQSGVPCTLKLFGSSVSGFGFTNSDVNINVTPLSQTSEGGDHTALLSQLFRALNRLPFCTDVIESFSAKAVSIKFTDAVTGKNCVVHVNNSSGVLLAELFREYDKCDPRVRPLATMLKFLAKAAEIDDQHEGTLPAHCYSILTLRFLQVRGVVPILHELCKSDTKADNLSILFLRAKEAALVWKTSNKENIGSLWLGLLRYYALEFSNKEEVVSILQLKLQRSSESVWNRRLSIQDPVLERSNLSRSLCSNTICDYIVDRFKVAYKYFGIPRTITGPLYDGIISAKDVDPRRVFVEEVDNLPTASDPWCKSRTRIRRVHGVDYKGHEKVFVILEDLVIVHNKLKLSEYFFKLDQTIIQDGEKPPKFCKSCGLEGHLKRDCPDESVPQLKPVLFPSNFTLQVLGDVMIRNYERDALDDNDVKIRQRITREIDEALHLAFPDRELKMFGSTFNGFGLHLSDVDICLRFKNKPINKATISQEEINKILTVIVEKLKSYGSMQHILAIPSAKVPIVKFIHRASHLEGDISLSNVLALYNTRMLGTYCAIDKRLKILGCFLKRVTKLCDISDASKGSLSSYGFVLMLIHFLQQHDPPVLPVLQELPPTTPVIVDGCDVSFFENVEDLQNAWPYFGRNQESVGQLWLAFLKYYTEIFNFDDHVIQIAQKGCLTRFSKLWLTDTIIAIEDPFDKSHNLGAGLTRRMGVYIIKTFQRFRESFHMSVDHVKTNDWMEFFLNLRRIRGNSNPPVDRQCRICHRIGHFAKNCTYAKRNEDLTLAYFEGDDEDTSDDPLTTLDDEFRQTMRLEGVKQLEYDKVKREMLHPENANDVPLQNGAVLKSDDNPNVPEASPISCEGLDSTKVNSTPLDVRDLEKVLHNSYIRFYGSEGSSENGVMEQMISRNPGVVFQLPTTKEDSSKELATSNCSIAVTSAAQSHTSTNFAPPPGFGLPPTAPPFVGPYHQPVYLPARPMSGMYPPTSASTPPPGFQALSGMMPPVQENSKQLLSQLYQAVQGVNHENHFNHYQFNPYQRSTSDIVLSQYSPASHPATLGIYRPLHPNNNPEDGSQSQAEGNERTSHPNDIPQSVPQEGIIKDSAIQAFSLYNKPPMMAMTQGQPFPYPHMNANSMNAVGNSYLMSHAHPGPVVSAIQSVHAAPPMPMQQHPSFQPVGYPPYGNMNYIPHPHPFAFQHYQQMQHYVPIQNGGYPARDSSQEHDFLKQVSFPREVSHQQINTDCQGANEIQE